MFQQCQKKKLQKNLIKKSREAKTVNESVSIVGEAYDTIEKLFEKIGKPIKEKQKDSLDTRIIEEIIRERLRGKSDVLEYTVSKGRGYRYPEFNPKQTESAVVYEEIVPARPNQVIRNFIARNQEQIVRVRTQFETLAPADPYVERRKFNGTLDRRAVLKYKRDIEHGKVPDPRVYYKKVIERREVATVFALNMNRLINQPIDGVPPRITMQQMMASILEASGELRDSIGIYGFSGTGKDNVSVYVFKNLEEPLTEEVYQRLAFLGGKSYSRNGAVYRHFTRKLDNIDAERRVFIEVCPTFVPYDVGYARETATKDSALAINGMRLVGIDPLCLCLSKDDDSKNNLNTIFGNGNFIITNPTKILEDTARAYARMTQ